MEQQINLLIINFALLALNVGGVFFISTKINKLNQTLIKPKSKKYPQEIYEVYDAINHGLKTGKSSIEITVDDVPMNWFVPLYQGLTKFYGFKLDLKVRHFSKDSYSEYLVVELNSYKGSTHKPLEPKLIFEKEPYYWDEEPKAAAPKQVAGMDSIPFPVRANRKPSLQVVNTNSSDSGNVIDFSAYKQKRQR